MGKNACWLQNDNPYGKSFDNRGKPCDVYGATDFIVSPLFGSGKDEGRKRRRDDVRTHTLTTPLPPFSPFLLLLLAVSPLAIYTSVPFSSRSPTPFSEFVSLASSSFLKRTRRPKLTLFPSLPSPFSLPLPLPVGLSLAVLLVGWVIRYSRNAARFSRFWNQAPVDDYELKQHRQGLLYGGGNNDDASSIRSRTTLAPPSTSTRNSKSPLSTYSAKEEPNPRDREYISTGYGDGGRGAAPDFPSGGSNQFYPGAAGAGRPGPPPGNQPWNNFPAGPPSTSQVNLHAGGGGPRDERLGFLNQSAMSSVASFGGQDDRGVGGRLPDIDRYNPNQYSPNQYSPQPQHGYANYPQSPQSPPGGPRPPQGGPRYGDPYGGR
ncbi:hypothetical protein BDY24DRAFT_215743 [Mrakia frigida]|uniref:uncharacterized protein n=1 Tax=Mrakia frigida TaxID=29902 RepID=UPI003FCBF17E